MIYTIGHSTHDARVFLALLRGHGITRLADVRAFPASRRFPHFNRDSLSALLEQNGIVYRHMPALGGRRRPRPDSPNTAWREAGFRGYADYMASSAFEEALEALLTFAARGPTAVMCAEALWWKCHRRLLADALVARSVPVQHIMTAGAPTAHELSEFARVGEGKVFYPALL